MWNSHCKFYAFPSFDICSIPLNLVCYFMWLHGVRFAFVHHRWKFNTFEIPKFNGHQNTNGHFNRFMCMGFIFDAPVKNPISYTYLEIDWHTKKCRNFFFGCQFSALPLSDVTIAKHFSHFAFSSDSVRWKTSGELSEIEACIAHRIDKSNVNGLKPSR